MKSELPQRFKCDVDGKVFYGTVTPTDLPGHLFFVDSRKIDEPPLLLDINTMCLILEKQYSRLEWLENPNDLPGATIEREWLSDEKCAELKNNLDVHGNGQYYHDIEIIKDWHKHLS